MDKKKDYEISSIDIEKLVSHMLIPVLFAELDVLLGDTQCEITGLIFF